MPRYEPRSQPSGRWGVWDAKLDKWSSKMPYGANTVHTGDRTKYKIALRDADTLNREIS